MKFDNLFKQYVAIVAQQSKDPDTKVGAVIVQGDTPISSGWNGLPRGVEDKEERLQRPEKYNWMVHAEANAILNAARLGVKTDGATLYINRFPCKDCAGFIIQAGIKRVVLTTTDSSESSKIDVSIEKFRETQVEVYFGQTF